MDKICSSKEYRDALINDMLYGKFEMDVTSFVMPYKEKWDNYFKTH